ncbi:hypothetical protein B4102_2208 [Heyndrickxia sporothermodurans]|uniref:MucBP domain-containing protein n=1 Tax=Heyndrickxia sporothermodurans TaxID=46224 RepID=A0A150LGV9_9BACI|nr:MucBP domain-containing protein [Heyndrickxia sporothermodurans]KYD11480.1 hypothetical protein B4102_2208 [Heyndrickxia sporothermodurans]
MENSKQTLYRWFPLSIAIVLFIQLFSPWTRPDEVHAAGESVVYHGMVSFGGSIVGDFSVGGKQAFCIEHEKPTPPTGTPTKEGVIYKDKMIAATLYWGWGGTKNIFGSDRNRGMVVTSLILSRIYTGEDSGGKSISGYSTLWDKAKSKDVPSAEVDFSKSSIHSSISGSVQKTETNKFIADSDNKVSFTLPSSITLHNTSTGKNITGGKVTLKGGDSFYLTAPLSYDKDFTTGNLKGSIKDYLPVLYKMSDSYYQTLVKTGWRDPTDTTKFTARFEARQKKITVNHKDQYNNALLANESYTKKIGSNYSYSPKNSITKSGKTYKPVATSKKTGTLGSKDITLTFYYKLQRKITVLHKDARDGKLLETDTYTKYRGDSYSYSPKKNLKKGEYIYRPTSTAKKTGTVAGSDITLTFYYDVPLIKTGLEKIQVYTAPADKGLPVKVNLSKVNNYPNSNADMAKAKLNVSLYEGSTKIISNSYTAKTLPKNIDFKVPSKYLSVNQKKTYTVKIEGFSKNEIDVISDAPTIRTEGYTSSEKALNINNTSVSYTGVIMTEREIRKNMVSYNESLHVNLKKLEKKITGYGFEYPIDVIYKNELGQKFTSKFDFYVPKSLVDTYLTYPVSNNISRVRMDETSNKEKISDKTVLTTTKRFELPEVNIEKRTGNLFSNNQVESKDSRLKYKIIDGGRKFYTPIWGDLGVYQLELKNVDPLGIHKINVSMKQNLEIYAFMYGHMDSTTGKQDAIYLRPINADDPKYPDKWSAEDKARFKKWNKNKG